MRAGQGDRQLDPHEGGRGEVHRAGPAVPRTAPPSWSWRSTSRARPTPCERRIAICAARLPHPHRAGRLPARGHHLRPQHLRRRHRHRGARRLRRSTSSRRRAGSSRTCRARWSPAASPTSRSRSAATTRCARRSTRCSCTTRSPPGWTWASSTPARWPCTTRSTAELRERIEDVVLNRRADADRAAAGDRRARSSGDGAGRRGRRPRSGGRCRSSERITHALVKGIDDVRRGRHRGAARRDRRARRPADRGDRGAADGRHERRRRPVRRRQDVPAAGGEVARA